jgi:hypothetical protein
MFFGTSMIFRQSEVARDCIPDNPSETYPLLVDNPVEGVLVFRGNHQGNLVRLATSWHRLPGFEVLLAHFYAEWAQSAFLSMRITPSNLESQPSRKGRYLMASATLACSMALPVRWIRGRRVPQGNRAKALHRERRRSRWAEAGCESLFLGVPVGDIDAFNKHIFLPRTFIRQPH